MNSNDPSGQDGEAIGLGIELDESITTAAGIKWISVLPEHELPSE